MDALIMAGGKGSRLGLPVEKPLLLVHGKPMVDWVVGSLLGAGVAKNIWVCVSPNTPLTARHAERLGLGVYMGVGDGYVWDMVRAIRDLGLGHTLVLPSDTPLIRPSTIRFVCEKYFELGAEALTLAVRRRALRELGLDAEYRVFLGDEEVCPVGISVLDGRKVGGGLLRERYVVWHDACELVNVNSVGELVFVGRLLQKLGGPAGH